MRSITISTVLLGVVITLPIRAGEVESLSDKLESLTAREPESATVGKLGDLSTLTLKGNTLFEGEDLCNELGCCLELQAACRPTAPLPPMVELLEKTLAAGYAFSGCPGTVVRVTFSNDESHLTATIREGRRLQADSVRFKGVEKELAGTLRERLTTGVEDIRARPQIYFYREHEPLAHQGLPEQEESEASGGSLWVSGEPVRWSDERISQIRQAVADELAIRGFPEAKLDLRIQPAEDNEADLVVEVAELGPHARLDSIEFSGLERHTRQEMLEIMGVKEGERLDVAGLVEAYDRLADSCRFWRHGFFIQFPKPADPTLRYATPPKRNSDSCIVDRVRSCPKAGPAARRGRQHAAKSRGLVAGIL